MKDVGILAYKHRKRLLRVIEDLQSSKIIASISEEQPREEQVQRQSMPEWGLYNLETAEEAKKAITPFPDIKSEVKQKGENQSKVSGATRSQSMLESEPRQRLKFKMNFRKPTPNLRSH